MARPGAATRPPRRLRLRPSDLALLLLAGLLLTATAISVGGKILINRRMPADRRAFSAYVARLHPPGRFAAPSAFAPHPGRDVVCAAHRSGARRDYRLCLAIGRHGPPATRISGGYRLPPHGQDRLVRRSQCFGRSARERACHFS